MNVPMPPWRRAKLHAQRACRAILSLSSKAPPLPKPSLLSSSPEDLRPVTSSGSPIEAQLLCGMLQAGGMRAVLADYHTVQTQPLWTVALGGIRVMVPLSQLEEAQALIEAFEAQQMPLSDEHDGDEDGTRHAAPSPFGRAPVTPLRSAVYPPDKASLLGIFLSPVFSALLLVINEWRVGTRRQLGLQLTGLVLVAAATSWQLAALPSRWSATAMAPLAFTLLLLPVLTGWYLVFGRRQSARLIREHGPRHARLGLMRPAFIGAAIWGGTMLSSLALAD